MLQQQPDSTEEHMDSTRAKQIFQFFLTGHFKDLLESVDRINSSSKSRQLIAELHTALNSAAERTLPTVVARGEAADKRLATPGTDFHYRSVPLMEGGPDELVAMLAMDVAELPASYASSIRTTLASSPEPLDPVRVISFVLTKEQRAGSFQRTMMIAARTATGSLVAVPWPLQWKVGDKVVGDSFQGVDPGVEEDRLNYLLYLVIDQDGATMRGAKRSPAKPLH